ncbi:NFAT activation molecule 1 [Chaetodon auriga]|uniref:NFAT activation molecule 1 n=1 Tax=Chaetodon auriga TaxID=39042 RepID=UPI0040328F3E
MDAQRLWQLSLMSTWIFVFFPSVCSRVETPKIDLESTVFVAFAGHDLNIECELKMPANQSSDSLTCSDPFNTQIYNCNIPATAGQPGSFKRRLELKNLTSSGEYSCRYKTAEVYWFLRVRDDGYKGAWDYTECIIVAILTGVLLVFSVAGSVYVFRGHWKDCSTECGNTSRKRQQNREERKERETEEDSVDVITARATSFYASLEPRPRSIYDVLDRTAANTEPDQSEAKPKKKKTQNAMPQTTQPQHEDIFECVYENF